MGGERGSRYSPAAGMRQRRREAWEMGGRARARGVTKKGEKKSRGPRGRVGKHRWRLRKGAEWAEAEQRRALEEKPRKGKSRMKGAEDGQAAGAETP